MKINMGDECPKCHSYSNKVVDTRINVTGLRWRRRCCLDCGERWNTVEVYEADINKLIEAAEDVDKIRKDSVTQIEQEINKCINSLIVVRDQFTKRKNF